MKAPPKATIARAKAALRKGTWPLTAPLEDVGEEAVEEELLVLLLLLELEVLLLELLEVLEPELVVEDAAKVRCKNQKERNWWACVYVQDPHWACCSAWADAWSAVVQFAWRHAAAAAWKTVLVQTQVMLVLGVEEKVREEVQRR